MVAVTLKNDRRAFGYNVGKHVSADNRAWSDTQITGGGMIQHGHKIASRETTGGFRAAWASPKGNLVGISGSPSSPLKQSVGNIWLAADSHGEPVAPSRLGGIRPDDFLIWDEDTGEFILSEGDQCYITFPSEIYYLRARNVATLASGGSMAFDLSNAVLQWYKADSSASGSIMPTRPSSRPYVYPSGNQSNPSYLAQFVSDLPVPSYSSNWYRINLARVLNLGTYVVPGVSVPQEYLDSHGVLRYESVRDNISYMGSFPPASNVPRFAGSVINWTVQDQHCNGAEVALYWNPTGAPSTVDLSSSGLPERLFGRWRSGSTSGLPAIGTAFDMTLLFHVFKYVILSAYSYDGGFNWNASQAETGYFNTSVGGSLYQIVPVAPKRQT